MAAAFFNARAQRARARAIAVGTQPAAAIHPDVVDVMLEAGFDLRLTRPKLLTPELAREGTLLVTMDCGREVCGVPHLQREEWFVADPCGKAVVDVRRIRDEIDQRVTGLLAREGWAADAETDA